MTSSSPLDRLELIIDPNFLAADDLSISAEVINTALAKELKTAGLENPDAELRAQSKQKLIMQAIQALRTQNHLAEAAALTKAAGEDPKFSRLRIRMLSKLRAFNTLGIEIAAQEEQGDLSEHMKRALFDLRRKNVSNNMKLDIDKDHAFFMEGPLPADLDEALTRLSGPDTAKMHLDNARAIMALRNNPEDDLERFAADLAWGRNAHGYFSFLSRAKKSIDRHSADKETRKLIKVMRGVNRVVDLHGMAEMLKVLDAGQSVLVCSGHFGMSSIKSRTHRDLSLPKLIISANSTTELTHPKRRTLGTRGDGLATDFLKAAKLVRKEQHFIYVAPDGGYGDDPHHCDVMGRPVPVGKGAAHLAWYAKAATFFVSTRWNGTRLDLHIEPGPVAKADGDREAFDADFYRFYADGLGSVVTGNPRDMDGSSGFWPELLELDE